ncbi:hypothetical protein MNBD_ALPHA04-740 [hydrothermal vent metagenome]|uniref:Uncharacterized protein n=1 Tax=hydrothermal vent metagenome TaxID=652676 RepID=A0A3B0RP15_9ZZZZ
MIRFSDVNRPDDAEYNPSYQRHHLIPLQVRSMFDLTESLDPGSRNELCLDDFANNGLLLPCEEREAMRTGRPLHRGPHPRYNILVMERMANIFRLRNRLSDAKERSDFFRFRIRSLQNGLRHGLIQNRFLNLTLNRRDPFKNRMNFQQLDTKIDELWATTRIDS